MAIPSNTSTSAAQVVEEQDGFSLQVLNLISVAQDIRSGRAEQLATRIEEMLPAYLRVMKGFKDRPLRTVAFHTAGLLYAKSQKPVPTALKTLIATAQAKAPQVLSDDCYKEMQCMPAPGCTPWPTSLRAVDVNTPDPMGWRYIVGSHCGFSWPKFWKLSCGAPIGLVACTG